MRSSREVADIFRSHEIGLERRTHRGNIGRGDKIRTCDPLHPMQVRYQAAPRPDRKRMIAQLGAKDFESREDSAPQNLNQFLEFQAHLVNQLLALIEIDLRIITRQPIAGSADGKALLIEQAANLPNDQYVLALIVAPVAAPFDRFELRKFLLPIAKHMRLDAA